MDYTLISASQRSKLRKKGYDIPIFKCGKKTIVGYDTKAKMICHCCKVDFIGVKDPASKRNFCSAKCSRSSNFGSSNPNYRGGPKLLKCKGCAIEFKVYNANGYKPVYCSHDCRIKTKKKNAESQKLLHRLRHNVRRSILSHIKRGTKNNRKWQDILGYSTVDLVRHLEKQFTPEMNWSNYGKYWHIDHITPMSWFKFTTPDCEAFKKCWSLSNLQPLEAKANIKKSNKLWLTSS
jgi:hypothetical protein